MIERLNLSINFTNFEWIQIGRMIMLSLLEFRTITISKTHILIWTPCSKFWSIMALLNHQLRVNSEYKMLTLISTTTIDQLECIASTRWLGHPAMAYSHTQIQQCKKPYFSTTSISNDAWKSYPFFFYLIRIRTLLIFYN